MTPTVQVGTILMGEKSPPAAELLALESEPYLGRIGASSKLLTVLLWMTKSVPPGGTYSSWQRRRR
jgi:hypothetical protein